MLYARGQSYGPFGTDANGRFSADIPTAGFAGTSLAVRAELQRADDTVAASPLRTVQIATPRAAAGTIIMEVEPEIGTNMVSFAVFTRNATTGAPVDTELPKFIDGLPTPPLTTAGGRASFSCYTPRGGKKRIAIVPPNGRSFEFDYENWTPRAEAGAPFYYNNRFWNGAVWISFGFFLLTAFMFFSHLGDAPKPDAETQELIRRFFDEPAKIEEGVSLGVRLASWFGWSILILIASFAMWCFSRKDDIRRVRWDFYKSRKEKRFVNMELGQGAGTPPQAAQGVAASAVPTAEALLAAHRGRWMQRALAFAIGDLTMEAIIEVVRRNFFHRPARTRI
jgi:hypothetical protein